MLKELGPQLVGEQVDRLAGVPGEGDQRVEVELEVGNRARRILGP